ncbi:MAG: hypothetical protein P8013_09155 [Candidatus Sulfobium sp.]
MRIVTYECEECGTEVVVTETGGTSLRPIYCCGLEVTEVSSIPQAAGGKKTTAGRSKKVTAKKTAKTAPTAKKATKKVAGKKTTGTARPAKRRTSAAKPAKK